ncbi:glycosyltransferase family 4 protein [Clostridium sediminicola]|uniref:glycosyltransferase n=1 Tax=Clostridium sediminicola TaxID=3114879 RepID=UPI0031F1EA77
MRICILTSGHDIFDNRIYFKEIMSLKKKYNEIYLIAPGEKDFITDDGITVKCFSKRKAWYDRVRPMREMFDIALNIKADVYHAHEPDSFQVALKLKKKLNSKAIFDSHEYHPEAFAEHFKIGKDIFKKFIYLYEKNMAKKADYIITVNNILVNKFKNYNDHVALIPNYPILDLHSSAKEFNEIPTFIYVGGIREDRGILKILESIKLTKGAYKYFFLGSFSSNELKIKVNNFIEKEIPNADITFTGKVPHLDVFKYLNRADAGFILLQPENWRYVNSEPIKLFEYMITKTAIIASDFPMMKNIIKSSEAGVTVDPTNTKEIAAVIDYLADNRDLVIKMGIDGNNAIEKDYNWSKMEIIIHKIYKKINKELDFK